MLFHHQLWNPCMTEICLQMLRAHGNLSQFISVFFTLLAVFIYNRSTRGPRGRCGRDEMGGGAACQSPIPPLMIDHASCARPQPSDNTVDSRLPAFRLFCAHDKSTGIFLRIFAIDRYLRAAAAGGGRRQQQPVYDDGGDGEDKVRTAGALAVSVLYCHLSQQISAQHALLSNAYARRRRRRV